MTRFVSFGMIAVAVTLSACSSFDPVPSGPTIPMTRLRAEPYSFTFYSGLVTSERLVVRDAAAWQTLWNRIHSGRTPTPPLPAVDFSRDMVVVVAMGQKSSGGYNILLERATEEAGDGIAIAVLSSSPGANCVVTMAVTAPVDIATLPLHPGPFLFSERSERRSCE